MLAKACAGEAHKLSHRKAAEPSSEAVYSHFTNNITRFINLVSEPKAEYK